MSTSTLPCILLMFIFISSFITLLFFFSEQTNLRCACLTTSSQTPANHSSLHQFELSGTARPGFCESRCNLLIPFAIVLFLMCLFGYMSTVPVTMVNLRLVSCFVYRFVMIGILL